MERASLSGATMNSKIVMQPPPERLAMQEASTRDLLKEALDEAKALVTLEIEFAKKEMTVELEQAKKALIGFIITAVFGGISLCLFSVALVLALGGTALIAVMVASGFLGISIIGAGVGYFMLPMKPFAQTRQRLATDFEQLKEHLA